MIPKKNVAGGFGGGAGTTNTTTTCWFELISC